MSEITPDWTLDQLVAGLRKECKRRVEVEETERAAVRQSADCKNTINRFQKIIDERIEKIKEDVTHESHWGRERERKENEDAGK